MKHIGSYSFPETNDEVASWAPAVGHRALARNVLAAYRTRVMGEWAAYIDTVEGQNHDNEWEEVLRSGTKLPQKVARALFPELDSIPYDQ
jgi:hypothetical protein